VAVVVGLATWRLVRPSARRRATGGAKRTDVDEFSTPGERVAALSAAVRGRLAERFDKTWLAKTTEEIAASTGLAESFGEETAERLVAFLRAADHIKFAPESHHDDPAKWLDWASEFVRAGARSRTSGK
jgi:hypothetical protein